MDFFVCFAGKPISVRCGYSGRVAVAYKMGSVRRSNKDDPPFVNLCVAIYECESSGGAEWVLEDKIHLKNITIPEPRLNIDLRYIYDEAEQLPNSVSGENGGSQVCSYIPLSISFKRLIYFGTILQLLFVAGILRCILIF